MGNDVLKNTLGRLIDPVRDAETSAQQVSNILATYILFVVIFIALPFAKNHFSVVIFQNQVPYNDYFQKSCFLQPVYMQKKSYDPELTMQENIDSGNTIEINYYYWMPIFFVSIFVLTKIADQLAEHLQSTNNLPLRAFYEMIEEIYVIDQMLHGGKDGFESQQTLDEAKNTKEECAKNRLDFIKGLHQYFQDSNFINPDKVRQLLVLMDLIYVFTFCIIVTMSYLIAKPHEGDRFSPWGACKILDEVLGSTSFIFVNLPLNNYYQFIMHGLLGLSFFACVFTLFHSKSWNMYSETKSETVFMNILNEPLLLLWLEIKDYHDPDTDTNATEIGTQTTNFVEKTTAEIGTQADFEEKTTAEKVALNDQKISSTEPSSEPENSNKDPRPKD